MRAFLRSKTCLSTLAVCCVMFSGLQAQALTVGEYRQAYTTAHVLDDMTPDQRTAYIAAHHEELFLAHATLESAELALETVMDMNLLQMQAARPPFVCNYDEETADIELQDWVEEFRKEALVRFKLEAGPKADQALDQVEFNDVLTHKIMEKYPCPKTFGRTAAHHAVQKTAMAGRAGETQKP